MKATKDFLIFQKHFTYWRERFGLTGYKVYFKYEPIDGAFADICVQEAQKVATIRLNSELPDKDKPHKNIKRTAKHEAIHLMLHKFEDLAFNRYLREGEVTEAEEEIVFKLEKLIV